MTDESPGLVTPGTALVRAADPAGMTECGGVAHGFEQRREAVTYSWPSPHTLRRSHVWVQVPNAMRQPCLTRVAHHEAAHVVTMREFGLHSPKAVATATGGSASWPSELPDTPDRSEPGPRAAEFSATAAAVYAAGSMAELLYLGIPWTGPLHYPHQPDYQMSERMLKPFFGAHSSAGHAFAQRAALSILQSRWNEVESIARVLIDHGEWLGSS